MAKPKPYPDLKSEVALGFSVSGTKLIIGVDEVGRGCLAGPVVAAATVLNPDVFASLPFLADGTRAGSREAKKRLTTDQALALWQVCDSKLVPEEARAPMSAAVKCFARGFAVAEASVAEINQLNILYASHLAMERAVTELECKLGREADVVLVDGHIVPKCFLQRGVGRAQALVKGDQKSFTIACASIIAKTYRDDLMERLDQEYPGFGLKKHKGYPTPFHKKQIEVRGVTPLHRAGFKGVSEFCNADLESVYLETDRVLLRPVVSDDAAHFMDLDSDPAVMKYISDGAPSTLVEIAATIQRLQSYDKRFGGTLGTWIAIEKTTNQFMGWFLLRPDKQNLENVQDLELGYRLKACYWSKGYATEVSAQLVNRAFTELGAATVYAIAMVKNVNSIRVMKKLGLRFQNFYTETQFPGPDKDAVRYSITRAEWQDQNIKT